jgi:serine/threonine protein kinase
LECCSIGGESLLSSKSNPSARALSFDLISRNQFSAKFVELKLVFVTNYIVQQLTMDLDQIHLNNQLCNYLRKKVGKTKSTLEYHKRASAGKATNSQEKAFREVELVVKRAEDLLLECMCTQSSWLDATITLADIKEEVLDIVLDLSFWKRMLKIATVHSDKGRLAAFQYAAKALKKDEDLHKKLLKAGSSLQEAADADMSHLLTKLLEVKEKHASGGGGSSAGVHEREYVLSIFLLASLKEDDRIATEVESQLKEIKWVKPLASGAHDKVSEVEWLQQQCVAKIVHDTDPKEASISRGCNHPHIVQFFWFWQEEKRSFIIMERMHEDLSTHIKGLVERNAGRNGGRPFQFHVAIDIMLQIAKAMHYLHNKEPKKIVHTDLKTSNILVQPLADSSEGYVHVKLANFGMLEFYNMSKTSSSLTSKTATSVYAAPEVFNLESKHGNNHSKNLLPKTDVWSFAMVCSEILTGTMPFDGEPKVNLHSKIEENNKFRPHLPSDCPKDLRFCITRCWECDPQKRPAFGEVCKMLKLAKAKSLGIIDCELLFSINHPMPKNPTRR